MSASDQVKTDYNIACKSYNDLNQLPCGVLESQLIKNALGNCAGLTVLDLGGGTGLHAREAVELGAASVDIVDISPGMLKVAEDIEKSLGRHKIRFFEGDVSKPLSRLPLSDEKYDVVMANWVFDHASSVDMLRGMFSNVSHHLKPGGRFVGVRVADLQTPLATRNDYGTTLNNLTEIPGGLRYTVILHSDPPIEFEGTSLHATSSGSAEIYQDFGLCDVTIMPYDEAEVVQDNLQFWEPFLKQPIFAVVRAFRE